MSLEYDHQQIIDHRWPGLWEALWSSPTPNGVEALTTTPAPTLLIDGIHLTSGYDRLSEARLQASVIGPSDASVWVYGFALGDLQRVLLERPTIERLDVVVLSPSAAFQSLLLFDHRDWLADERITVHIADGASRLRAPFVVAPAALQLCGEAALVLRDQLRLALAQPMQQRYFDGLTEELAARVDENRPQLEADGDVASLFEVTGERAIPQSVVVAAGPTLDDWIEWLKAKRTERLVIAVSTALAPLQQRGIDPDVVVVVDHLPGVARHFQHIDEELTKRLQEIPLVYASVVDAEILRSWPGPRLVTYLQGQRYPVPREELPKGELYCAGTVTHSAIDLAVKMGMTEVTLLGVDFCFPRQHSHAEGAAMRHALPRPQPASSTDRRSTWILNGHGERVPTETNMVGYLRDLEAYIAAHPDTRFRKAGRDGAALLGASWIDEERPHE